jgi:hypothetical protein
VSVSQLQWPADLFDDMTQPVVHAGSARPATAAASPPELSLWLVMQGLWRVNAAWMEEPQYLSDCHNRPIVCWRGVCRDGGRRNGNGEIGGLP